MVRNIRAWLLNIFILAMIIFSCSTEVWAYDGKSDVLAYGDYWFILLEDLEKLEAENAIASNEEIVVQDIVDKAEIIDYNNSGNMETADNMEDNEPQAYRPPTIIRIDVETLDEFWEKMDRALKFAPESVEIGSTNPDLIDELWRIHNNNYHEYDGGAFTKDAEKNLKLLYNKYLYFESLQPEPVIIDDNAMLLDIDLRRYRSEILCNLELRGLIEPYTTNYMAEAYKTKIVDKAKEIVSQCGAENKAEIIRAVAQHICKTSRYAPDSRLRDYDVHELLGYFDTGVIVCDGYARVFQAFMYEIGIDCIAITTKDHDDDGITHQWNKVNLYGNWYNVDVCWMDTADNGMRYLLCSDKFLSKTGGHSDITFYNLRYPAPEKYEFNQTKLNLLNNERLSLEHSI